MNRTLLVYLFAAMVLFPSLGSAGEELPEYQPQKLSDSILSSVGSDSMGGLMRFWVERYRQHQSSVNVKITSLGSATAPPALIQGIADFGPMARPMKMGEREDFMSKFGFEPTQIRTALAAVAVYVPNENPLNSISIEELDGIFSSQPKKASSRLKTWGSLGLRGKLGKERIVTIGRPVGSYLHSYFRQQVLLQGPFLSDAMNASDAKSMFLLLATHPASIAYGDVVNKADAAKLLAISRTKGGSAKLPTKQNLVQGTYPLARYLNIYVVREPGSPLEESVADFLRFVLSKEGQNVVRSRGLKPLPSSVIKEELAKLE